MLGSADSGFIPRWRKVATWNNKTVGFWHLWDFDGSTPTGQPGEQGLNAISLVDLDHSKYICAKPDIYIQNFTLNWLFFAKCRS